MSTPRFGPPPPHELLRVLGELERCIWEGDATPIVKAGLVHAQFETIHPLLYLSLYIKQYRGADARVRAATDSRDRFDSTCCGNRTLASLH